MTPQQCWGSEQGWKLRLLMALALLWVVGLKGSLALPKAPQKALAMG